VLLAFERGAVQMVEHGHQRRQVAPTVREQIAHQSVFHAETAFQGVTAQGGGFLFVVERLHFVDQRLADARAQILAQIELQRRTVAGEQQSQPQHARGVEDAEQCDLGRILERIDGVDDQQAAGGRLKVGGGGTVIEKEHRAPAQRQRRRGAKQVRLAAACGAPQIKGVEAAGQRECAQAGQQLLIFSGDEIVQAGRLGRLEVEQQLGQGEFR